MTTVSTSTPASAAALSTTVAFCLLRTEPTESYPRRASSSTVASPMPEFAPVVSTVLAMGLRVASAPVTLDSDVLARLGAAVVLGAAIGFEREASDQPAGLRTHITVAIGACLFGVISTLGFSEFEAVRETTNVQVDVTRVASQVVVGIGFLGAGMIFRQGGAVKNLTTAASLWVTSAIGLAAGVGDIGSAAIATAAVLVSLVLL